jgi:hypothetical protein
MAAALAQSLRRIVIVRAPRNSRIARVASPLAATAGDQANQFGKKRRRPGAADGDCA